MALLEKNEDFNSKTVKIDGFTISWDDDDDPEIEPEFQLDADAGQGAEKKPIKGKKDDFKTKKVVI